MELIVDDPGKGQAPGRPQGAAARNARNVSLEEYIDRIAEELHRRVEHQRLVFKHAMATEPGVAPGAAYCPLVECHRLQRMRDAVQETINVLEETRSAFKSKKLEVLRKKLIEVVAG